MPLTAVDTGEPDDHSPEIAILVSVPEEFLGAAIAEINQRRGYITAIEHRERGPEVWATVPAAEFSIC